MSSGFTDTVVAPITGIGRAAVAVVRISGPDAWTVASAAFPSLPRDAVARHAYYGRFEHGDDGLCLLFAEGASYTGEASAEFSVHGSPASVQGLVDLCVSHGCRLAEPGEFTLRAFLNGRMDLSQAEAVRDVVDAQTERQLQIAYRELEGQFGAQLAALESEILGIVAAVEASVDFEEEIGPLDRLSVRERVTNVLASLRELAGRAVLGDLLRSGLRVALVGRPNVGKSSLLNALAGTNRAIVTDIPGTTRDVLEVTLDMRGYPVILMDTAGLHESRDLVEAEGMARAISTAETADCVLLLYDASEGWTVADEQLKRQLGSLSPVIVGNKADILLPSVGMAVSAKTGAGLSGLTDLLCLRFADLESVVLPNRRQAQELQHAVNRLGEVRFQLDAEMPDDLLSVGLTAALTHLGRITGKTADADMLSRIFSEFCIGK